MAGHSHASLLASIWLSAVFLFWNATALAGQLQLTPLSLDLSPSQPATTLTLRNEANTPVTIQVRVFNWQQDVDVGMQFAPTTDIALSPAMATLAAGASQIVRIVALNPKGTGREQHYRVLVDELPDAAGASRNQIKVLTRYSLPLFLEPLTAGLPKLSLRLQQCADGRQRLVITNNGERRARIANWRLRDGGKVTAEQVGLAGYALPGSSLALPLSNGLTQPTQGLHLDADTDLGPWQADAPFPPEPVTCAPPIAPN